MLSGKSGTIPAVKIGIAGKAPLFSFVAGTEGVA